MTSLFEILVNDAKHLILNEKSPLLKNMRSQALEVFLKKNLPCKQNDEWQHLNLDIFFKKNFHSINSIDFKDLTFSCELEPINTFEYYLFNSKNISTSKKNNSFIVKNILEVEDHILENYLNTIAKNDDNGFNAINTAAFSGGFYIEIPDNTIVEIPLQLISINNFSNNTFSNARNIIRIGKNSTVKIIQCDDIVGNSDSFINCLTEVFVAENACMELYRMFNLSNDSAMVNSIYINQEKNSKIKSFSFELNAGLLRNNFVSNLNGNCSELRCYGIYLTDKQQQTDNNIKVVHNAQNCFDEQIFKGIIDDSATTIFKGLIIVEKEAQKTVASQTNKNVLLTNKAQSFSKPFLEIYADDVKCSHGTTMGQLDEEALFYMQTRGISLENAKKLLLHAFIGEIVKKIEIEEIAVVIDKLTRKRLNGELSNCDSCVIKCSDAQIKGDCH